jgi:hypothetical protein
MSADADPVVPATDPAWLLAIHEGGHAVAAAVSGFPVWVTALCGPGDPVGGFCSFSGPPDTYDAALAWFAAGGLERPIPLRPRVPERVMATLAGPIAESQARGVPFSLGMASGWYDIYDAQRMLAGALRKPAWSAWVRACLTMIEAAATRVVVSERIWIEAVAEELVAKRQLSSDDVLRLRPGRRRRAA